MAYIYFNDENQFHNDMEEYINGYINLVKINEAYSMCSIISALQDAYNRQILAYEEDSGYNKITILSAQHVVEHAINEVEEEYPIEEFPELWV